MKYHFIIFFLSIIFLNINLYLAINVDTLFFYSLMSFFFLILYFIIIWLIKMKARDPLEEKTKKTSDYQLNESAEDHPIIQSARKRLGK